MIMFRRVIALLAVIALLIAGVAWVFYPRHHDGRNLAQGAASTAMRVGVHENYQGPDKTTLAQTLARFPQIDVTREFEAHPLPAQDLTTRIANRCGVIWQAGKSCVWSFKPLPADVTSGAWKPYVVALGHYLTGANLQSRTVVVIWHEPENDVPHWFKSPADFVRIFNTVDGWLTDADPTIVTSHAALGYRYTAMSDAVARQWVTHATVQSIDLYSGRATPLDMTLDTSVAFARWKRTRPTGSRWGVSERGWIATAAHSAARAASIRAEANWLVALAPPDRPDFYIVWNTPGTENDPLIPLDQAGRDAVNAMFARLS